MFYEISYDVVNDGRQNGARQMMLDYGYLVHYSMFKGTLEYDLAEKKMERLKKEPFRQETALESVLSEFKAASVFRALVESARFLAESCYYPMA